MTGNKELLLPRVTSTLSRILSKSHDDDDDDDERNRPNDASYSHRKKIISY
jgi:hypothetical protein